MDEAVKKEIKRIYDEKTSLNFLLEERDEEEYGEEVYKELYCKTSANLLNEYRLNDGTT